MDTTAEHENRPRTGFWIAVILCLLVAYPLSIGPVAWLVAHGFLDRYNLVVTTYCHSIDWLGNESDVCRDLIIKYVNLWGI